MKRRERAAARRYGRGSIAVETAILLPFLVLFLAFPSIMLAFYFRQYSAVQKAAHDAALYLSMAPRAEMNTAGPDGNFAALTVAQKIVEKELSGIVPSGTSVAPSVFCTYRVAAATQVKPCTPQVFKVDSNALYRFDVGMNLPYINPMTGNEVDNFYISIAVSTRYLGN